MNNRRQLITYMSLGFISLVITISLILWLGEETINNSGSLTALIIFMSIPTMICQLYILRLLKDEFGFYLLILLPLLAFPTIAAITVSIGPYVYFWYLLKSTKNQ